MPTPKKIELAFQRRRQFDEDPRRSHDVIDRRHRHEDEADREQHLVEMASRVEVAIQRALQHHADQGAGDKGQRQRREERPAGIVDQHGADIAAGHREGAMGEIDEVHQPERHREPAGEHEQQHAVGDAVEQDGEQRGHGLARSASVRTTRLERRHAGPKRAARLAQMSRPSTSFSPREGRGCPGQARA